jgi:VanZ family protein
LAAAGRIRTEVAAPFLSPRRLRVLVYGALIVYGSLYPFVGWRSPHEPLFDFLAHVPDFRVHRTDALTNVLAYMPLGLFIVRDLRLRPFCAVLIATLAGASLSFTVESVQQFLPDRVSSLTDLATNTIGTLVGAKLGALTRLDVPATAALARWRNEWLGREQSEEIGVLAVAVWVLSQWVPFVPSLDLGELRQRLSPLWHTLLDPDRFDPARFAAYALDVGGLTYLAGTLGRDRRLVLGVAALAVVVVFGKVVFAGRVLSLEAMVGTLAGVFVAMPAVALRPRRCAIASISLILGGFAVAELRGGILGAFFPFTWIPFRSQLESPLTGIASLVVTLWPAVALSYLARFVSPLRQRMAVAWLGGLALTLFVFALEWNQQFLPGRVGDITNVLLMVVTWAFCWILMADTRSEPTNARRTGSQWGDRASRARKTT